MSNLEALHQQKTTTIQKIKRWFFLILGFVFVAIGLIGVILPVLPTTPFLILATGCFARSSTKFHQWLYNHPTFGDYIQKWEEKRAIPRKAKYLAWSMMSLSCAMLFYRLPQHLWWLAILITGICLATAVWMSRLPDG